jgi:5-methyltetrahydrofolate--homocysteine methyltransferase
MNRLIEALHSGRVLVMDGAMGTELQRLGLRDDECSAEWNITHPEQVAAVHAAYLEAGAEVLLTNTFLANREALGRFALQHRLSEIWQAALANARLFTNPSPILLADVGPFVGNFSDDAGPLIALSGSADGVLLETATATVAQGLGRWLAAANHPNRGGPDTPLLISLAYQRTEARVWCAVLKYCATISRTILHQQFGVAAIGANCGREIDMDDLLEIVRVYRDHTALPVFVRPNAGTPKRTASGWEYPRSPEYMADKLWPLLEAGVTMVGGCCGTTPAHIAAFRRVVDEWNARR